ncbi:MAG: DNA adenine methylase [Nitrospinae bacterium]|nr:DNA adenine methylase [Nitrospinota bacterium]
MTLFDAPATDGIVNVASIPKRSPFRYPGGKTWLIPRIRRWLENFERTPSILIEPFAGGAIVGLTAAFEHLAERVVLVELDAEVAAVWKTILEGDSEWLARRILSFDLTEDNIRKELAEKESSVKHKAFRTIIKNRTYHGGILAPGSGFIKVGENGKGIRSRWYPETLARRIRLIAQIRDRISIIEGDGISVIQKYARNKHAVFFIDPPYTVAGKKAGARLYTHHLLDHEKLFAVTKRIAGDFLMTYDNNDEIVSLAKKFGFQTKTVAMKNTHHAHMRELLVGRDLSWVRD